MAGMISALAMPVLLALLIYRIVNHQSFGWVVAGMMLASFVMWQSLMDAIYNFWQ